MTVITLADVTALSKRAMRSPDSVGLMLGQRLWHWLGIESTVDSCLPSEHDTLIWPNAELMLARRLRRRPNINPALGQQIVFDEYSFYWQSLGVNATCELRRVHCCWCSQ